MRGACPVSARNGGVHYPHAASDAREAGKRKGPGRDRSVTAHVRAPSTARNNRVTGIRRDAPLRPWPGGTGPVSEFPLRERRLARDRFGAFQTPSPPLLIPSSSGACLDLSRPAPGPATLHSPCRVAPAGAARRVSRAAPACADASSPSRHGGPCLRGRTRDRLQLGESRVTGVGSRLPSPGYRAQGPGSAPLAPPACLQAAHAAGGWRRAPPGCLGGGAERRLAARARGIGGRNTCVARVSLTDAGVPKRPIHYGR